MAFAAKREAKWNPGETAAQQKAHYEVSDLNGIRAWRNVSNVLHDRKSMKMLESVRSGSSLKISMER